MSEVINNVSKNENITFNNELINEVILHSGNRNTEKLSLGPNFSNLALWHVNSGMTADYCSTGQQKAILVSIVLGYSRFLNNLFGSPPILLLDEINAHLDIKNFQAFYEYSLYYKCINKWYFINLI